MCSPPNNSHTDDAQLPAQYELWVTRKDNLTPHMRRIVLQGESLNDFPADQESGYVKLMLQSADADKPLMRSYTIRAFDVERCELTLDFVDHGDTGPASTWARQVAPGEPANIRGPGEKKLADPTADWFILAGDMSALPALAVNLEQLPEDARGYAVIEILSEDDKQDIAAPSGMDVRWLINPDNETENTQLFDAVRDLDWLEGTPYPWFAGEFNTMRLIRRYFRDEKGIDKRAMYVSSYWKIGDTDEGMKLAKRMDAEA